MLTAEKNAYLCEVEPGRPMHELLRRYWLPAGLTTDVAEPNSEPLAITLLGLNFVMFRNSDGDVGILDERCSHRGASLTLGRVEPGGIRCIYHGWKFNIAGEVLEMPNVGDQQLGQTFKQPAYPVREKGGLIWVYLGPPELEPPFPKYPFLDIPEDRRYIGAPLVNCNFVQVLEGGIDSAHLGVLHADAHSKGAVSQTNARPITGQIAGQFINATSPKIEVENTEWGFRYAALRDLPDETGAARRQARVTAFVLPFSSIVTDEGSMLFAVPLTSEWTVHYHVFWKEDEAQGAAQLHEMISFLGWFDEPLRERERARFSGDISGTACRANHYRQNRAAMRDGSSFAGISNVVIEDLAVTETMGAITDRSLEHLVPSDAAVLRARRILAANAERVAAGDAPAGLVHDDPPPRAGQGFVTPSQPWRGWFDDWLVK
jgi:phthalate 4,5-dioxygenase oxygenase subunit